MFVRVKNKANGKMSVQIVESYRKGTKVSQKIVRHVGVGMNDREVSELKKLAESIILEHKNQRKPALPLVNPEKFISKKQLEPIKETEKVKMSDLREEQRIIDGIGDVFGKLFEDLGYDKIISGSKKDSENNEILKSCVIARLANPASKRRTASMLEEDYGIKIPLDKIYRMMDHLHTSEKEGLKIVSEATRNLFKDNVDILFFDVTTLYFESVKSNEIKDFGFSKDGKFKEVQVMLALVTTSEGLPITYKLFPGNTYEGNTLIEVIEELKSEYEVDNIVLVADRAMFNRKNLLMMDSKEVNVKYVVAATLKRLNRSLKEEIVESDDYIAKEIEGGLHWVKEWEYEGKRLIVSYSSERAKKDAKDRQRLIDRLMKKLKKGKCKVKDVIPNYGTKKYLNVEDAEVTVNEAKIEDDAKWDGLHGVITNIKGEEARSILSRYKGLWQIEEAFRVSKHDLKMRPVYHWSEGRISAHVMMCFISFSLIKQALHRLKIQQKEEMSFERLRNELLHVQSSLLIDIGTKKKYIMPSKVTLIQKKIYQAFGIKRTEVPMRMN